MSAQRQHVTNWTIEEYLAFETHSNAKHEYFQGAIHEMAGSTPRHNDIASNAALSLRSQMRGRPCSARGMDQRLRVQAADLTTYTDVLVVCPPEHFDERDTIAFVDASVILEVLPPSTAQYDKTSKFDYYCHLPSFRHYLLVEQSRIHVEHRFLQGNGQWATEVFTTLDDVIELSAIECQLKLREIYEEIEF